MSLGLSNINTLLGGGYKPASSSIHDIITGKNRGSYAILQAAYGVQAESSLTKTQQNSLSSLSAFVKENVNEKDQAKLFASIASLQKLLELGNESSRASTDSAFALLAGNSFIATNGKDFNGLILNQLT